ncbi:DUF485 domain-containing protein [Streptomyces sp. NPDC091292]|uniref:DUF485 domain-containing protein n=1 Tax=Streptomyces sp. NPDC091292 TaxID=3365991 RepID=UPI00382EC28D
MSAYPPPHRPPHPPPTPTPTTQHLPHAFPPSHDSSPSYTTYPRQPHPPEPTPPPRHPAHACRPTHTAARRDELRRLRGAYRWQRRVATLTALGYFTLFLVLSAYAPGSMTRALSGGMTTGLLLGVCQLPVACLAVALYEYTARRRVDPLSERLRLHTEADGQQERQQQNRQQQERQRQERGR